MKIDLSIYQSILFNDLRPWLDSNADDNRFRSKLTPSFKNPNSTSIDFDNAINNALIDYKSTLHEDDYLFELSSDQVQFNGVVNEILYPLIEVIADEPTNNKATFYYYLIKNEATRLINNLYKFSYLKISESEKKNVFIGAIKGINSLIQRTEQQKIQVSKNGNHSQDHNNTFVLNYLGITLIRLHLEVKELFENYVTGNVYDEAGIYSTIIKKQQPIESHIKDTVGLNHFKVTAYINQTKHKKETTLEWILYTLETYTKYFQTDTTSKEEAKRKKILLDNLQALENLHFLQHYKIKIENITYSILLEAEELEPIFNDTFQDITEAVEVTTIASKKLLVINKELQKLDFIKYDIDTQNLSNLQSIPRQLQDALIGLKSFVNANLSIDFSKLVEPKTNPLKTGLTVPQIAFLFKILSEHNDIGIETKTKTELYNFISQNFATKKSTEKGISIKKLAEYFNEPDPDAQAFWYGIIANWFTDKKKFNKF